MKPFFAIAPWEYPGADFDATPHAVTTHHIGGRERTLWLKMREGVIYFLDVATSKFYAVPQLLDQKIALDDEHLVAQWKAQVDRQNYGEFLICRRKWARSIATGSFCIILRVDGSGWIKEHFDESWHEFAASTAEKPRVWGDKPSHSAGFFMAQRMGDYFLERAVDALDFQAVAPRWEMGGADELAAIVRSAAALLVPRSPKRDYDKLTSRWPCQSNSLFYSGISENTFPLFRRDHPFNQILTLAKWHNAFIGVDCRKASEHESIECQMGLKTRKSWLRGMERWGEDWRGNWWTQPYKVDLRVSPPTVSSYHDKLETTLVLRDFLGDKLPAAQVEALLRDALNG